MKNIGVICSRNRLRKRIALILVFGIMMSMCSMALASGDNGNGQGGGGATVGTSDLFNTVREIVNDIFTELVTISTLIAALGITIAFFIRLLSRNQRAVEEANAWIKRIIISWLIINSLAFFVGYGKGIADKLTGGKTIDQYL